MPAQPLTYPAAIDTLFGLVKSAFDGALAASIVGYDPIKRWQGRSEPSIPPNDKIWARISAQIVTDNQASLANATGQMLFHAKGLMYIQLFCPRTDRDLTIARILAQFLREVFRVNSPNIWFSNQKIVELAPTPSNYPITISANYEYDSIPNAADTPIILSPIIARGKHFPVEAVDGTRSAFTFVGIPANPNFSLVFLGGQAQDGFSLNGQTIDFGVIIPSDTSLYAIW